MVAGASGWWMMALRWGNYAISTYWCGAVGVCRRYWTFPFAAGFLWFTSRELRTRTWSTGQFLAVSSSLRLRIHTSRIFALTRTASISLAAQVDQFLIGKKKQRNGLHPKTFHHTNYVIVWRHASTPAGNWAAMDSWMNLALWTKVSTPKTNTFNT